MSPVEGIQLLIDLRSLFVLLRLPQAFCGYTWTPCGREREDQAGFFDPDSRETLMEKPSADQIRGSIVGFDVRSLYHQVGIVLVVVAVVCAGRQTTSTLDSDSNSIKPLLHKAVFLTETTLLQHRAFTPFAVVPR